MNEREFELKRNNLVRYLKESDVIKSLLIEKAFLKVKRELFMPSHLTEYAYSDNAFPIGFNQTISQPYTIAVMLELLDAGEGMKVLEVGSGSGYVCALLSEIVGPKGKVFGIELVKELFEQAKENLKLQGCRNAELFLGDGTKGLSERMPFDRILLSAAAGDVPEALVEQLSEGGKIVAPVGDHWSQQMQVIDKSKGKIRKIIPLPGYFVFVPLKKT
ncbi:MAG: protein-L-isoaspartate(D-aspartate) O-methyltransferase [Candidatus Diapherotrites archaeon]